MSVSELKMSELSFKYIFSSFDIALSSIINITQLNTMFFFQIKS